MKRIPLPDQKFLNEMLDYCKDTGTLKWKERKGSWGHIKSFNSRFSGKDALNCIGSNGYKKGCIDGVYRTAHRVIWKMVYGNEPDVIDHIDGDKTNNRIINLRSVSYSQNSKNAKKRSDNKSGITGVFWLKREKKWAAEIYDNGQKISLGFFDTLLAAKAARESAESKLNYSPRHGV